MRLEQLKYLIEVANSKSINKAAQNLYLTQPALSIAINALEDELQYPLLKRTKSGVVLTDDGARVVREAKLVLDTIQGWYLDASEEYELEGVVHLLAIPSICIALSDTLIFELQKKYPKLSVFLHEKTPQYMLSSLENDAVNIGLTSCFQHKVENFLRKVEDAHWIAEKLADDERYVMINASHPLAAKDMLSADDLQGLTLAYYSDLTDNISESYKKYFNQERCFRLSSREGIMQLVAAGGAVAIFPDKMTRNSYFRKSGLVKAIPTDVFDMSIAYFMVYPEQKMMSMNELCMVKIIREQFNRHIIKEPLESGVEKQE